VRAHNPDRQHEQPHITPERLAMAARHGVDVTDANHAWATRLANPTWPPSLPTRPAPGQGHP
jgi:hypothetical protein